MLDKNMTHTEITWRSEVYR